MNEFSESQAYELMKNTAKFTLLFSTNFSFLKDYVFVQHFIYFANYKIQTYESVNH